MSLIEDRDQTDRVTALPRPYVLDIDLWPRPWPITLTFILRRAMFMTSTHKNSSSKFSRFKRKSGNRQTDRQTIPIASPSRLNNHMSRLQQSCSTCYLWPWLGPCLTAMQYDMYFQICGWRHAHNGANRPETKTARMFRTVRQVAAPVGRQTTCLVEFITWRHRRRSLMSPSASC